MDPYYLVMGTNKSKFKPPLAAIKERYYAKFSGNIESGDGNHGN